MKLVYRQKYRGKARTVYRRRLCDQRWARSRIEEYLFPEIANRDMERFVPVVHGADLLAHAKQSKGDWNLFPGRHDVHSNDDHADDVKFIPIRPQRTGTNLLNPAQTSERVPSHFSWRKFFLGCALGTAAAIVVLVLLG